MSTPLRVALIGTGSVAKTHAEALTTTPELALAAVHSRDAAKRAAFAAAFAAPAAADLESLLARGDVDAVSIATPSGAHAAIALMALAAGKHVICEKPLDIDLTRIDAMIAAARRHRRTLGCIFQQRFSPAARRIRAAIDAGRFGALTVCHAATNWWRDPAYYASGAWRGTWALDGGGALMNQGIHAVDLLQWFAGEPVEVAAVVGRAAHPSIEVEDTAMASVRFANGAFGTIQASTAAWPGQSRRIEVSGTLGTAVLVDDRLAVWRFQREEPGDEAIRAEAAAVAATSGTAQAVKADGHRAAFLDFAAAIGDGRAPAVDGEAARRSVATVLAVYEAARNGRATRVQRAAAAS